MMLDIQIPRTIFEDALAVKVLLLLTEAHIFMNHEVVLGTSQHFSLGAVHSGTFPPSRTRLRNLGAKHHSARLRGVITDTSPT